MTPKHIYLILPISNKKKTIFLAIKTYLALKLAYLFKLTKNRCNLRKKQYIYLILPISNKKTIFLAIKTHLALKLAYLFIFTKTSVIFAKKTIYLSDSSNFKQKNNILSHQNTFPTKTSIFIQINKKKQYIFQFPTNILLIHSAVLSNAIFI